MISTTTRTRFTHTLFFISVLGGCVPLKGDLGEYSATEATGSDSGSDTETDTGAPAATTDDDSGTTGEPAFPNCQSAGPDIRVDVEVDAPTLFDIDVPPHEFDVRCTVEGATAGEIVLRCSDDLEALHDVTLTLETPTPKTGLLGGETDVRLHYRRAESQEFGLDIRTHVSLHAVDDGALLLFYTRGLNPLEPQFADFWAPLELAESELGACPAEPDGVTGCQTQERFSLEVGVGMATSVMFDANVAAFPPQSLWFYVERAVDEVQTNFEDCFDFVSGRSIEVLALVADV
jgi:hypothetical protein